MKIGLSTAAFYGVHETEDAAARIAALGIPCCEVFLETFGEYKPAFGSLVRSRLGETAVASVHAKTTHFEDGIMGQSLRQKREATEMMHGFLDTAQVLGASVYVYHGPANLGRGAPPLSRWEEPIADAMEAARTRGIALCWETVNWCYLNHPDRVREFLKVWPSLHFVLDTKQVWGLGQEPIDYVEAMGDRLRHVHVLDRDDNGRLTLPGPDSAHDFRELALALRDHGYDGNIILEPYARTYDGEQDLLDSIHWLRDCFGAE